MNPENAGAADEILCPCSGTTRKNIQRLFALGMDIAAISHRTGALSGCGGCEWDIAQCLSELAGQQDTGA